MIQAGFGHHEVNIPLSSRPTILFHVWLYQWAAATSTLFSKLSICLFYLRVINDKIPRIGVFITMAYVTVWSLAIIIIWICRCYPIQAFWTAPGTLTCMTSNNFTRITGLQAGFGASTHFLLITLPMSTIWKLRMSSLKRAWLLFVLWLGGTCCLFAIGRVTLTFRGVEKHDTTWYGYKALLFQALEVYSQVFYICIPFIRPVASHIRSFSCSETSVTSSIASDVRRQTGSKPSWPFDAFDRESVKEIIHVPYPPRAFLFSQAPSVESLA
jgi:hypothetical protein